MGSFWAWKAVKHYCQPILYWHSNKGGPRPKWRDRHIAHQCVTTDFDIPTLSQPKIHPHISLKIYFMSCFASTCNLLSIWHSYSHMNMITRYINLFILALQFARRWIKGLPVRHDCRLIHNTFTASKRRSNISDLQGINKFDSGHQISINL